MLTAQHETEVDYVETARLANEAFAGAAEFDAERLAFVYDRAFSNGAAAIALMADGRKVGQVVALFQTLAVDGRAVTAAQLIDLFVLKEFRSRDAVATLYAEVAEQIRSRGIDYAIGLPNAKAQRVNQAFMKLEVIQTLPFHMGLAIPRPWDEGVTSRRFADLGAAEAEALLAHYATSNDENGLVWTGATLAARLTRPGADYGLHLLPNLLAISVKKTSRGIPHTLICGFFVRAGATVAAADVDKVTRAACRFWGRPIFVYAGLAARLPRLPGFAMPRRIRPSPLVIQFRDMNKVFPDYRFDRCQLIDFDTV